MSSRLVEDSLKLKAAIEFGSEYIYTIKNGGHGPTLFIFSPSRKKASEIRKKAPSRWENLQVIVTYSTADEEEDDSSYDPTLT